MISSIALLYGILLGINLPAPLLGLEFDSGPAPRLWYQPPGWVIPAAWFVLFALLGIARHRLMERAHSGEQKWILALAVLCASYSYYTLGLSKITGISPLWFGLAGNLVVIAAAAALSVRLHALDYAAAWLVAPAAIWTAFATAIVIGEMRLDGLIRFNPH